MRLAIAYYGPVNPESDIDDPPVDAALENTSAEGPHFTIASLSLPRPKVLLVKMMMMLES